MVAALALVVAAPFYLNTAPANRGERSWLPTSAGPFQFHGLREESGNQGFSRRSQSRRGSAGGSCSRVAAGTVLHKGAIHPQFASRSAGDPVRRQDSRRGHRGRPVRG